MTKNTIKPTPAKSLQRRIGYLGGVQNGPTVVFFGGVHGNEMAGVKAIEHIFQRLQNDSSTIKGAIYGIRGNMAAQLQQKRYLTNDLNRLWTKKNVTKILDKAVGLRSGEEHELVEIYELLTEIINTGSPPYYFIDLHTTSSKTLPFITINDAMINRDFSKNYPVPIILGIEEYLEGPLLSHMNERGYVSLGFESGQHTDVESVINGIAFIWLTLVFSGVLTPAEVPDYELHFKRLQEAVNMDMNFYEVMYRHALTKKDNFEMLPGFKSFQKVSKGEVVGIQNQVDVSVQKNAILFMPLYQKQGEDGFFLIRPIPDWALKLSRSFRKNKIDGWLTFLPGISWGDPGKESLLVNTSVAKFFAKSFFHLLGYRNRSVNKTHLLLHNRERAAKNEMYRNEWWFKG
tara:strand:- start:5593 stop:6798 length:1206 start_codon:yes stop_codon:yes gene_type:complete